MSWIRVRSSQLHSLRYSPEDETLEAKYLCYNCGGDEEKSKDCLKCRGQGHSSHYRYKAVPVGVYAQVRDDKESIGAAFNRLIKKGMHVDPPQPFQYEKVG